jgi:hypothetical protein
VRQVLDVARGRAADRGLHRALENKPLRRKKEGLSSDSSSSSSNISSSVFFLLLWSGVEGRRHREARRLGHGRDDRRQHFPPDPFVPDDASGADAPFPGLELRLDQDDELGGVLEERGDGREDLFFKVF